jgi:hypothetical protein
MLTTTNLGHTLGYSLDYKAVYSYYAESERSKLPQNNVENVDDTKFALLMNEVIENYNNTNGWASINPDTAHQLYRELNDAASQAALTFKDFNGSGCVRKLWKSRFGGTNLVEVFPFAKGP